MSKCFNWFSFSGLGEPNITPIGLFYKEVGRLWKESAQELIDVLRKMELVQLVQLKKYGNNAFKH